MNSTLLLAISLNALCNFNNCKTFIVFDENCKASYTLKCSDDVVLVEKETQKTIQIFSKDDVPYFKDKFTYFIYAESDVDKYFGIKDDKLYNITRDEYVEILPTFSSYYDEADEIKFSDIPTDANFCKYSYYFDNLSISKYGKNINGTCCIVSMQILMGYYDSIYEEELVEDKYDNPSIERRKKCSEFVYSPGTKGDEFHRHLINLFDNYLGKNLEKDKSMFSTDQFKLIEHYVGAVRNLSFSCLTCEGNWNDIFQGKQFKIAQEGIKAGRPVIVNNKNHSMLGFAYDDNYIYCMSGWYSKQIVRLKWDDFNGDIFSNYAAVYDLVLESFKEHKTCTNSYINRETGESLCPICQE